MPRPHQNANILRRRGRESAWYWIRFSAVLLTIPAFYLELVPSQERLHRLGWWLYLFISVTFTLHLAWVRYHTPRHQRFLRAHWLDVFDRRR